MNVLRKSETQTAKCKSNPNRNPKSLPSLWAHLFSLVGGPASLALSLFLSAHSRADPAASSWSISYNFLTLTLNKNRSYPNPNPNNMSLDPRNWPSEPVSFFQRLGRVGLAVPSRSHKHPLGQSWSGGTFSKSQTPST